MPHAAVGQTLLPVLCLGQSSCEPCFASQTRRSCGRLSRPGALYAVFVCAGQYQTIIGSHHPCHMCINGAKYEVDCPASPVRPTPAGRGFARDSFSFQGVDVPKRTISARARAKHSVDQSGGSIDDAAQLAKWPARWSAAS